MRRAEDLLLPPLPRRAGLDERTVACALVDAPSRPDAVSARTTTRSMKQWSGPRGRGSDRTRSAGRPRCRRPSMARGVRRGSQAGASRDPSNTGSSTLAGAHDASLQQCVSRFVQRVVLEVASRGGRGPARPAGWTCSSSSGSPGGIAAAPGRASVGLTAEVERRRHRF